MFGKRPGYQVSLRRMATLQSKIEGWEVGAPPESSLFPSVTENVFINQQPSMLITWPLSNAEQHHLSS